MWNERDIEGIAEQRLTDQMGPDQGKELFAAYICARRTLVEEVLPEIKAVLPDHPDHGPEHVAHVLDNAGRLLDLRRDAVQLSGMDLYALLLAVLFHDTGNVFGRDDHPRRVSEIYDYVRATGTRDQQEKFVVVSATLARCGETTGGSLDTLRDVPERVSLFRFPVKLQAVSSILRFADELEEGPHRTSQFMQLFHDYTLDSDIFHKYARAVNIDIDRGGERIALTYNIDVGLGPRNGIPREEENRLRELLEFTYKRITKLNQERRYARHYCDLLGPFKKVTVTFNFWANEQPLCVELPEINDLVVPGDREFQLEEYHSDYELRNLLRKLREQIATLRTGST